MMIELEHVNVTVTDPQATAKWMQDVFGWDIRWEGTSMQGDGYTIHIGTPNSYVALYTRNNAKPARGNSYGTIGGLNHIAVTVDDLDKVEAKVKAHFETHTHGDYEPGRRFYFHDADQVEFEVVCYA